MFDDHPDQVNVFSKAGSLVLGDMRILHAAHENKKSTRRNLLLIWHNRPQTVPDFWKEEGRPVPDWLAERLEDGPPDDLVTTRVQGTGVELELPEELQVNTAPLARHSFSPGCVFTPMVGRCAAAGDGDCLLYTSPSPRDATLSRMPSSA